MEVVCFLIPPLRLKNRGKLCLVFDAVLRFSAFLVVLISYPCFVYNKGIDNSIFKCTELTVGCTEL